jgi:transposase
VSGRGRAQGSARTRVQPKWSSLRAWGMKIAKARGMARVRVAVARKLAVIRMWSDQTEFRFGKEPVAAA